MVTDPIHDHPPEAELLHQSISKHRFFANPHVDVTKLIAPFPDKVSYDQDDKVTWKQIDI